MLSMRLCWLTVVLVGVGLATACAQPEPAATPTPQSVSTGTPTLAPTPTPTSEPPPPKSAAETPPATILSTPTAMPAPTRTPTPSPMPTAAPTPTLTLEENNREARDFPTNRKEECTGGRINFDHPPFNLDQIIFIRPLGAMSGGHVTPTDHQYWRATESEIVEVYSPGGGFVTLIERMGTVEEQRED